MVSVSDGTTAVRWLSDTKPTNSASKYTAGLSRDTQRTFGVDRKPVPWRLTVTSELMLSLGEPCHAVLGTTTVTVGGGSARMCSAQVSDATMPSPLVTVTVYAPCTRVESAASELAIELAVVAPGARS